MHISTIFLIILAALVALGLVVFQYYYKSKKRGKLSVILSFLRFIAFFSLFLLLINPKFTKKYFEIEKTNLTVLVDNSSSIKTYEKSVDAILNLVKKDEALKDKYDINYYKFGKELKSIDTLNFLDSNTDIAHGLKTISNIYARSKNVTLLISDGNQTIGQDYEFYANKINFPVYPVVVGDTSNYEDLRVSQVNSNKYAFLKNKFPIEIYLNYYGNETITTPVTISVNGKKVHSEQVNFSKDEKVKRISSFIEATKVGLTTIQISTNHLKNEKNTKNNSKTIAVEVIDEKTKVAIVSAIQHPDIGALKKAIETNEQRSVSILKPSVNINEIDDFDVFICYQPDQGFDKIYKYILNKKASNFVIVGTKTNLNFLNSIQKQFQIETGFPEQEIFGISNSSFSKYDISDFNSSDYPPLLSNSGQITFSESNESLLKMNIQGIELENSMLSISENNTSKTGVLLGENIWKWRMAEFKNAQNFQNFDEFIGKLLFYLVDKEQKSRLNIDYQSVYENVGVAKITATYFNAGFVFDEKASLILKLNNTKEIPMLLRGNYFEADLNDLKADDYNFTVKVQNSNLNKSGKFTILDFDVEQQFLSANPEKLERLAEKTNAKLYFPEQIMTLLADLKDNPQYAPTQKSVENVVSLIDFKYLLGLIVLVFTLEWFIRKYNGLI